ncbi:hypothetical protein OF113_14060 [Ectopseudomonas chengduensis]|nr:MULTISPECIES: hypothetical protein [Pseudomonas]MDZ4190746.1 hypothetical protein [Pseudomonas sp.]UZT76195.1 hypothetical protein OF113_14060 [Pseudomonas chengduensis]
MKDILDAAVDQFRERLSSPLMASFLISWPIWNYKFVLVFFSDMKPYVKFSYISNQVYPDLLHGLFYGLAGPLLTACFYVGIYPFIVYCSEFVSNWHRLRLERQRIKNNDETPLSEERARELWQDFRASTKALEKEIEEGSVRIRNYKAEVAAFDQKLADASNAEHELRVQLAKLKLADEDSLRKYKSAAEDNQKLRDMLSREELHRSELSACNNSLAGQNAELSKDVERFRNMTNEQAAARADDAKSLSELKSQLEVLRQENSDLKRVWANSTKESAAYIEELAMLRGRVGDLESNLANAHADLKKQKSSEAQAMKELGKVTQSLNVLKRKLEEGKKTARRDSELTAVGAQKLRRMIESRNLGKAISGEDLEEAVQIAEQYKTLLNEMQPIINLYEFSKKL